MDLLHWKVILLLGVISAIFRSVFRYLRTIVVSKKEVKLAEIEMEKEVELAKYKSTNKIN